MNFNKQHRSCVVTLSAAKGLSRWAERCFAEFTLSEANVLSMTVPALVVKIHNHALCTNDMNRRLLLHS